MHSTVHYKHKEKLTKTNHRSWGPPLSRLGMCSKCGTLIQSKKIGFFKHPWWWHLISLKDPPTRLKVATIYGIDPQLTTHIHISISISWTCIIFGTWVDTTNFIYDQIPRSRYQIPRSTIKCKAVKGHGFIWISLLLPSRMSLSSLGTPGTLST